MARLGLYQPFIEDRNVRRLYQLKVWFQERHGRRVPMTVLVNRILDEFFDARRTIRSGDDVAQVSSRDFEALSAHLL